MTLEFKDEIKIYLKSVLRLKRALRFHFSMEGNQITHNGCIRYLDYNEAIKLSLCSLSQWPM